MDDDFFFQPDDLSNLFGPDANTPDLSGILGDPTSGGDLGINIDPFTGGTWGTPDLSGVSPSTIDLLGGLGATGGDLFTGPNWLSALGSLPNLGALLGGSTSTSGGTAKPTGTAQQGINIPSWLQALGVLGSLGTGLMSQHATQQATQQAVNGINAASDQAKQLIGAAQSNYAPFTANVGQSLAKLAAPVNLAGNFKPLGSGKYGG